MGESKLLKESEDKSDRSKVLSFNTNQDQARKEQRRRKEATSFADSDGLNTLKELTEDDIVFFKRLTQVLQFEQAGSRSDSESVTALSTMELEEHCSGYRSSSTTDAPQHSQLYQLAPALKWSQRA